MATRRTLAYLTIATTMLVLFGCASDPGTNATGSTRSSTPVATGPAPGVTDDTIKIGITYVDTAALLKVGLGYNLGNHEAAYRALIDDINQNGGINGRKLEAVFAPIDPTTSAASEAACLKLTDDDHVFLVTGFWLDDAVLCPADTHAAAVVGGTMTPQRTAQAKAPWLTWTPDTDQAEQIVRAFAAAGELKGKVAVFGDARESEQMDNHVLPVLKELGIEPVATGTIDAPRDDTALLANQIHVVAERFKAAGADTVLIFGLSGTSWPTDMQDDPSYRPKLLFLDLTAAQGFATNSATTDLSVLEGSAAGGGYGPDKARYDEPKMQACIDILKQAGVDAPPPAASNDPGNQPYQAAFQACPDMALLKTWLEAAGPDLNYGTLESAMDGLQVSIPGDPAVRTYGPPPAADGNPTAYIFAWDPSNKQFVRKDN